MANEKVTYIIEGKDRLSPTLTKLNSKSQTLDKSLKGVGQTASKKGAFGGALNGIKALNPALLGVASGMAVVTGAFALGKKSLEAFNKQEQAIAQVRQGLESTGGVAGRTLEQLQANATALQRQTLFGDEDILQNATAQLLTFTNIAGDNFDRTQGVALDLATRLDGDLKSASIQLGKALNDPVANLSALSRSGIQFSKSQKQVIKDLAEGGELAKAQGIILDELEKQYGGSAKASAQSGTGALIQLQNTIGDILEDVGGAIAPVVNTVSRGLNELGMFITDNLNGLKAVFKPVIDNIKAPFMILFDLLKDLGEIFGVTGDQGTDLAGVFNILGTVIEIVNTPMRITFKILGFIIKAISSAIKWVINFAKSFEIVVKVFKFIQNLAGGFVNAIIGQFDRLKENALSILGGLGDLLIGIFTFDTDKIKEGLSALKDTASKVASDTAKDFSKGFEKGLDIKDFFSDKAKSGGTDLATIDPTTLKPKGGGATGKLGADLTGASGTKLTNLTINIGKLIEDFSINTTNLKESSTAIKEEVTKALLTSVNDVNLAV